MEEIDSTSSSGIGSRCSEEKRNRPRSVMSSFAWSSTRCVYSLKTSYRRARVACLEPEHRLGVEQVRRAAPTPLVLAAGREADVRERGVLLRERGLVPGGALRRDLGHADAAELRGGAGEVLLHELGREADGLERLGGRVGGHRRDAHLRHDLEDALAERLDQVLDGLLGRDPGDRPGADELLDRLHREVRVDRGRRRSRSAARRGAPRARPRARRSEFPTGWFARYALSRAPAPRLWPAPRPVARPRPRGDTARSMRSSVRNRTCLDRRRRNRGRCRNAATRSTSRCPCRGHRPRCVSRSRCHRSEARPRPSSRPPRRCYPQGRRWPAEARSRRRAAMRWCERRPVRPPRPVACVRIRLARMRPKP